MWFCTCGAASEGKFCPQCGRGIPDTCPPSETTDYADWRLPENPQARRAKLRGIGYGVRSDFELNFGRYLPGFGRPDDHHTDTQTASPR